MQYLKIRNWETFQHYHKRNPPWIKVHNQLLTDYEFSCLQDASKAHLMLIWLLASQTDNKFPNDPAWIQKKIGSTQKPDCKLLIDSGFLEVIAECSHGASKVLVSDRDRGETEGETETETEGETETPLTPLSGLNVKAWDEYTAYRRETKRPKLKARTVEKQQAWLAGQGDQGIQADIVSETIRNGWTGLFELKAKKGNGKTDPKELLEALEDMHNGT